jgi:spore coat protein E
MLKVFLFVDLQHVVPKSTFLIIYAPYVFVLHKMTMTKEEVYITMTFHDNEYREIITKAVCGSGRKQGKTTDYVTPKHIPTSILGCWIINHKYHAKKQSENKIEIRGTYDINIWYSCEENSKTEVVTEKIEYFEEVDLSNQDMHCLHAEDEVMAKVTQQPHCLQCKIEKPDNQIAVEVEKGFVVDVIGETKINVKVAPGEYPVNVKGNTEGNKN